MSTATKQNQVSVDDPTPGPKALWKIYGSLAKQLEQMKYGDVFQWRGRTPHRVWFWTRARENNARYRVIFLSNVTIIVRVK